LDEFVVLQQQEERDRNAERDELDPAELPRRHRTTGAERIPNGPEDQYAGQVRDEHDHPHPGADLKAQRMPHEERREPGKQQQRRASQPRAQQYLGLAV
jgi:hypothetical protein